jgi:hypothetical protein
MGHKILNFLETHPFLNGTFHAYKSDAILVFQKFADRPNSTVSKMIDVVNGSLAILEVNQITHHLKHIVLCEDLAFKGDLKAKLVIKLQTTNRRQIVPLRVGEQIFKKSLSAFQSWRIPWS